ncbi:hypothetical protein ACGFK1_26835 [Mycobacterium sp. NPDC048908]|uniref:hypothetical protein n=1 Tax=Mycobacterium sp. NPDC048908 TaxID=3364292 RepID=UPI0037159B93
MRLVANSGLWSTGQQAAQPQLVAVLEVSGAVLSWIVDDPAHAAQVTFTDLDRADWLWRVLGEQGHVALAAALDGRAPGADVEITGVDLRPESLEPLRRLALGHWLRRWWPVSERDGIAALDSALLDAEIAMLTAAAEEYFTDDTFDSDVAALLRPHAAALSAHLHAGDPRVVELVTNCAELADDVGVALVEVDGVAQRRDDYALAAGADGNGRSGGAIATGTGTVHWGAVPSGIFDAAEDTIEWRIEAADGAAKAVVRVALSGLGLPAGIAVRVRSAELQGSGTLDGDGVATFAVVDAQHQPVTESTAWDHDWRSTTVTVGTDIDESPQTRERIRQFARSRLRAPAADAFLAEVLAAESDY